MKSARLLLPVPLLALAACGSSRDASTVSAFAKSSSHGSSATCSHVAGGAWRCRIENVPTPWRISAEYDRSTSVRCYVVRGGRVRQATSVLPPCRDS